MLFRSLSGVLWEAGADFSDGITLQDGGCRVHISPLEDESALSVEAIGGKGKDRVSTLEKYYTMARELDLAIDSAAECEYLMQE